MNVLDLFSGIGGFSLGLERVGFTTVAFCEIEPYCQTVLKKHWPNVPIYEDVKELTAEQLGADGISVDVICGGFPCQDISYAGAGAGIKGSRSGLWSEFARLIGELRPRYAIVENVSALLGRGLSRVLGDLAAFGFDAEWHCIPASAVGAPHRRDRVWIIAYPMYSERGLQQIIRSECENSSLSWNDGKKEPMADTAGERCGETREHRGRHAKRFTDGCEVLADANRKGLNESWTIRGKQTQPLLRSFSWQWEGWQSEPNVGRVAHGVPDRMDRLKALGNAVVPQIPEIIGKAIMSSMK